VAGFEVAVGDGPAGAAGLRRHLDRSASIRRRHVAEISRDEYLRHQDCLTIAEIAFLQRAEEREATLADAARTCPQLCAGRPNDLLAVGERWVRMHRGQE
jgi:hypothetical protein